MAVKYQLTKVKRNSYSWAVGQIALSRTTYFLYYYNYCYYYYFSFCFIFTFTKYSPLTFWIAQQILYRLVALLIAHIAVSNYYYYSYYYY